MLQIDQKKGSDQFENDEQISDKPIKKIKKEKRDFQIVKYKQKSFSFGKLL